MQPGSVRWLAVVTLLGGACAVSPRVPAREHAPHASPAVARAATDDGVWMDCRVDADCDARPGTVCHAAVMGGTCAPACEEDDVCQSMDGALRCVGQRCAGAVP